MTAKHLQSQRTIWLLTRALGGKVIVDESEVDPLWDLNYRRIEGSQTKLEITASLLAEPTEEQMQALAKRLIGTARNPRSEAINVGIVDLPMAYLNGRLAPHAVWNERVWISREEHDATSKAKG